MELLIILIIILLIFKLNSANIRGALGEKQVARKLASLDNVQYKVIDNLLLKTPIGTSQIDHVVVSVYGIFVIETKNYKGWIIGNEYDDYWKQVIYKRKEKLRNPIKQNYGHIKVLQENLAEYKGVNYISLIAFNPRATLKVNTKTEVVYSHRITKAIKRYEYMTLSLDDVKSIYNKLISLNVDSKEMRKEHVKNVRTNIKEQRIMVSNNICPRCGGTLVKRNGRNGKFIGCSSFPKCRYTNSLN